MPRSRHRSTMASSRSLASGVALLDPVTGEGIGGLRTPSETWSATWSRDGRMLAFGSRDGIWTMDIATGAEGSLLPSRAVGGALVGLQARLVTRRTHHRRYGGLAALARRCRFRRGRSASRRTWRGHPLTDLVTGRRNARVLRRLDPRTAPAAAGPATVVVESRTRCGCPATSRGPRRQNAGLDGIPGRTDDGQAHRHRRQQRRRHRSAGPVRRWLLLHLRQLGS